jgi:peptidoglycan/xylan/chitin deacetylase (PgdA/CDA1 family)
LETAVRFADNYAQAVATIGLKQRLFNMARSGVLSFAGRALPARRHPTLTFFYCHFVFDDQRKGFAKIIDSLLQTGRFVDTDTAVDIIDQNKSLDTNYYHLSFDDGLKNVVRNALPILKERNVPAILFVPTSLIGTDANRYAEHRKLDAASLMNVEHSTWEDLVFVHTEGFEIGAHTQTHVRLSAISNNCQKLEDEIGGSKLAIEQRIGTACKYFSWPYGTLSDVDDEALRYIKAAGFRACFGAFRQRISPGLTSLYKIPRHHFEAHWPTSHVRAFACGFMEQRVR